jgi:flagellar P-ring protein precursor FlgI
MSNFLRLFLISTLVTGHGSRVAGYAQNKTPPAPKPAAPPVVKSPASGTGSLLPTPGGAGVRIKDITQVQGVRDNQLIGFGLVVGLNATGDSQSTTFTVQSVINMLARFGITVPASRVRLKNVAAVMLTAALPPFAKSGDRIDVLVSSIGDASNLQGGTLLQSPLQGADNQIYAVAQGPVSIGGFNFEQGGNTAQKNHTTVGRIPFGAFVEREVPMNFVTGDAVVLSLTQQDFTTARRIAEAIDARLGDGAAEATDAGTVSVKVPATHKGRVVQLLSDIGNLTVEPDAVAKVVINERTGTVVLGSQVRIAPVAVAHGNLSVEIKTNFEVSQPLPLAPKGAETVVVPQTQMKVKEPTARLIELGGGATIGDLVKGLNALGVTPRDMIAILQAIKNAGALQANLEIM